ncbi:hypothetical protein CJD36_009790 [Flavipsychrobacter stenotrophus]|uniref:Type II toxin-antitoxin system RelE/ParE family toxin n=1 Tax=Flavipsychrobacter stenotrophus TaxID=2077091 RepID=A0A2S7SYP5_9BACT|nr:hypothetical protein CJD36_009790 [Flavipsychrobacter stenotrophus]
MDNKIVWSEKSQKTFNDIIEYLLKEWTEKEILNFIDLVHSKLDLLYSFPYSGTTVPNRKNTFRTVIHKRVILIYDYKPLKKKVTLLFFWNTRQDPKGLKF